MDTTNMREPKGGLGAYKQGHRYEGRKKTGKDIINLKKKSFRTGNKQKKKKSSKKKGGNWIQTGGEVLYTNCKKNLASVWSRNQTSQGGSGKKKRGGETEVSVGGNKNTNLSTGKAKQSRFKPSRDKQKTKERISEAERQHNEALDRTCRKKALKKQRERKRRTGGKKEKGCTKKQAISNHFIRGGTP